MATDLPIPVPNLPGYTFRSVCREDLPAIHQMLVTVAAVDHTSFVDTLEDMTNQFIDPLGFTAIKRTITFLKSID